MNKLRRTTPWNKGRAIGRKAPLSTDALELIRRTRAEENWRELAMLEVAVSTMLPGVRAAAPCRP